jgi:hypothetical protein
MIAVGDVWTFDLEMKLYSQQVYNTFALQLNAVPAATSEAQFVDAFFAAGAPFNDPTANLLNKHRACCSIDLNYVGWHVARVSPNPTQPFFRATASATYGVQAGTAGTSNLSACISRVGASAGRRQRGRIAVPGCPESAYASGVWTNAQMTLLQTLGNSMVGSGSVVGGYTYTLGYWSPQHTEIIHNVPVVLPPLYVNAVTSTARNTVRVQRSRTIGVGR